MLVIYLLAASPLPSIVLPSGSDGPPSLSADLRRTKLRRFTWTFNSRSAQHRHRCRPGGLLPRLLTLTLAGSCFLLHWLTLADHFPLGSRMPCVARTFLSSFEQRQAGSLKFSTTKVRRLIQNSKLLYSKVTEEWENSPKRIVKLKIKHNYLSLVLLYQEK